MFNLYYPDYIGGIVFQASFESQQAALDQAALDGKDNYTIQQIVDSQIVMVMSV